MNILAYLERTKVFGKIDGNLTNAWTLAFSSFCNIDVILLSVKERAKNVLTLFRPLWWKKCGLGLEGIGKDQTTPLITVEVPYKKSIH